MDGGCVRYMGSKKYLLQNGLGKLLKKELKTCNRFIDLFAGSGTVSWFAAENSKAEIIGCDLQEYGAILVQSVVGRTSALDVKNIKKLWIDKAKEKIKKDAFYLESLQKFGTFDKKSVPVKEAASYCEDFAKGTISKAYGGHYFSPQQARIFDILLLELPEEEPYRSVCLASLIEAASDCSSSPGHTAQPLRPNVDALPYIADYWSMDVFERVESALKDISPRFAKKEGYGKVVDAIEFAEELKKGDLVFVDPPYSSEQYSRFYHVLETIARGSCSTVSGAGRYPPLSERPSSKFSLVTEAKKNMSTLLKKLSESSARVIITFPNQQCSNGLSSSLIQELASEYFEISEKMITNNMSTLGGKVEGSRPPKQKVGEMVLLLTPKVLAPVV